MILRSMLFAPGNVSRRIEKALQLNADAVILDLEDSVPIDEKKEARINVQKWLQKPRKSLVYVRVNALSTNLTIDDFNAVFHPSLDGVMLSKVEASTDVKKVDWYISHLEMKNSLSPGHIDLIPLVENAKGIHNAYDIAVAGSRVKRMCFGAIDYVADIGVKFTDDPVELLYARSHLVNVSKAADLEGPIDTVYPDLKNMEGLDKDARIACKLGFQGKLVIHPNQIDIVNKNFTPSAEDIAFAQKVVAAYEKAKAEGQGAITLEDGKFIDEPVVKNAYRVISLAEKYLQK